MQSPELSLAGKLDTGLTKILCALLGGLKTASLWLTGFLTLAVMPWMIFEYGEGLSDLSPLEWGFMPLLALLLWRHIRYCRHFSSGFWHGLNRILIFQGVMSVLTLALIGAVVGALLFTEHLQSFLNYLQYQDPISKLASFAFLLLTVYLAAPTRATDSRSTVETPSAHVEPFVSATAKEASL